LPTAAVLLPIIQDHAGIAGGVAAFVTLPYITPPASYRALIRVQAPIPHPQKALLLVIIIVIAMPIPTSKEMGIDQVLVIVIVVDGPRSRA